MLCLSSHRDTGIGSVGARGAAAPLIAGRRGLCPPYKFASMGLGNKLKV